MNKIEKQRQHFNNISDTYLKARQHKNHLMIKYLLWDYFLASKPNLFKDGAKVLEPMCGYSEGKTIIETHCHIKISYTGFDYSRPMVEETKRCAPEMNVFVQDVTTFDASEQFDLIILIGGLHHVYEQAGEVLARLMKVLSPEGYFISFEPTHNNKCFKYIRERIYNDNKLFDEETERAYDFYELNELYRSVGLDVVDQVYPGLISYVMYYNPDAFPKLNIGGIGLVRFLFNSEKPFYRTWLARKLSFATLSLLRKRP